MPGEERVLVAYGTKYGATAEIAYAIGDTLRAGGLLVDVRRARSVRSLQHYRAVVLGSAVYAGRWRSDAVRLLRRPELADREVWLFSSGPVGERSSEAPPDDPWTRPKRVRRLAAKVGPREQVVFGGAIADDDGLLRKRMARRIPEELRDLRDWDRIDGWARSIAVALGGSFPAEQFAEPR